MFGIGSIGSLLSFLTGIGSTINKLIDAHTAAVASGDQVKVAEINAQLEALRGAYGLAATAAGQVIVLGFALVVWVYFAKVVIWDNVMWFYTSGTTPPIHGDVSQWMWLVMTFIFGHGLVTSIFKR